MIKERIVKMKKHLKIIFFVIIFCLFASTAFAAEEVLTFTVEPQVEDIHTIQIGDRNEFLENDLSTQSSTTLNTALKESIKEALIAHDETLDVTEYNIAWSDAQTIQDYFSTIYAENPDLYYALTKNDIKDADGVITGFNYPGLTKYYGSSINGVARLTKIDIQYYDTKEVFDERYAKLMAAFNEMIAQADKGDSDFEKALILHDAIILETEYTADTSQGITADEGSPYGILVNHDGVCEGYARTYDWLLQQVGIEASLVKHQAGNHAWSLITIDDKKYHVDVTWDDPLAQTSDYLRYTYFLLTDEEIKGLDEAAGLCDSDSPHMEWDDQTLTSTTVSDYTNMPRKNYKVQTYLPSTHQWYYTNTWQDTFKSEPMTTLKSCLADGSNVQVVVEKANDLSDINRTSCVIAGVTHYNNALYTGYGDTIYKVNLDDQTGDPLEAVYTLTGDERGDGQYYSAPNISGLTINADNQLVYEYTYCQKIGSKISFSTNTGSYTFTEVLPIELPVPEIEIAEITLDQTTKSCYPEDTFSLNVTVAPENTTEDQTATWTSSDESVATVDQNGNVIANQTGTATISVKVGDKTAMLTLEVKAMPVAISYQGNTELSKAPENAYGNVNGKNGINSADALEILQYAVGLNDFSQYEIASFVKIKANVDGDFNQNNQPNITSKDALTILQRSVGIIKYFPIEA